MAEFNVWLLILGVVGGAVMAWLVLAESGRREREIDDRELPAEATWIARTLGDPFIDAEVAEQVLRAHRQYLGFTPPDALVPADELMPNAAAGAPDETQPPIEASPPSDRAV